MMLLYSKTRGIKLWIFTLPVMTPKLSSYWLYFVTSTSYKLAVNLVDSMKMEVVCKNNDLPKALGIVPITYVDAIKQAFLKIEQNLVVSSWKDSLVSSEFQPNFSEFIQIPTYGCLKDHKTKPVINLEKTLDNIFSIGGARGWYYGSWMWKIRGAMDKLFDGIG